MKISPDFAKLDTDQIAQIKNLEQSLDIVLVAFEKLPEFAELTDVQLEQLKTLEEKLGFNLVAWK